MELTIANATSVGPVRKENEDSLGSSVPETPEEKRSRGHLIVVADGVAGSGRGGDASRLAVKTAIDTFLSASRQVMPRERLAQMFEAANLAVYDAGMVGREQGRGVTTMTAAIFLNGEITLGHVGDCRAFLLSGSEIHRLTADHSYAGTQVRMGFLTEEQAMKTPGRYQLTRAVGREPFVRVDYVTQPVSAGAFFILCSDGLHGSVPESDLVDAVLRNSPADACKRLVSLAEKRGSDDNITVQIARIDQSERVTFYRGSMVVVPDPVGRKVETEVGKVLDDRFELQSVISEGGMASVYKALDRENGQMVAVKIPFMRFESDPVTYGRFQREESILRGLEHPSILRLVRVEKKSRPYLVTEFLEGQTLADLLDKVRPMPVADAVRIASKVGRALEYLHSRGVVHRDLKPQNIMICDDGTLRIFDFGISLSPLEAHVPAAFTATMGTPDYMAPEQVRKQAGDERTDVYSLGALLYEMVTGRTPYQGSDAFIVMNARLIGDPPAPRTLRPDLSAVYEEIILHAMERDPSSRYQTATAFLSDLEHPDLVRIEGRASKLVAPKLWKASWRRVRTGVYAFLLILAVFGFLYAIAHQKKVKVPKPAHSGR